MTPHHSVGRYQTGLDLAIFIDSKAECSTASDCAADEYCENGECIVGCVDDSTCTGCSMCVNNSCTQPECCPDTEASDCTDPAKPVCSSDNTCVECIGDEHCEQGTFIVIYIASSMLRKHLQLPSMT